MELKHDHIEITLPGRGPRKPVRFGMAADSHYALKEPLEDKHYAEALLKMRECTDTLNLEGLEFLIHLGDFKDEGPLRDPERTLSYLRVMEWKFQRFDGPVYHCLGNHDLDSISKQQFLGTVKNTGIDPTKSFYNFWAGQLQCLVLDSNYDSEGRDHFFLEGSDWQHPYIPEKQLDWLEKELDDWKGPSVIFCHHPFFPFYHNDHKYHIDNFEKVRQVIADSGKVQAVFFGHTHHELLQEFEGIPYIGLDSMLEGRFTERNCFYIAEFSEKVLRLNRFERETGVS